MIEINEKKITKVKIITEVSEWDINNCRFSVQDKGKTLKIFAEWGKLSQKK